MLPILTTEMIEHFTHLSTQPYLKQSILKDYNELKIVSDYLKIKNPRQVLYHLLNNIDSIPLCICGDNLSWNSDLKTYRIYCSKKCSSYFSKEKRKHTCILKYGVDHPSKRPEFLEKVRQTSLKKYGTTHYSNTEEYKSRVVATNLKKYGTETPFENVEIVKSVKQNWILTTGVSNPAKLESVKEKIASTNLKKYQTTCVLSSPTIKEKIKKTNIEKYGSENPMSNSEISSKASQTRKINYYHPDVLNYLNNKEWLSEQNVKGKTVGKIAEELDVSASNLSKYFNRYKINIVRHFSSSDEKTILNFLDKLKVKYLKNDRKTIHPYELDIVIPSINLAIEINGGYWHHEGQGKNKSYHINKTNLCKEKNIELWHFYDWEVHSKLDIIKSMILHKLQMSNKIYARNLHIITVNSTDASLFLEKNHLQGSCISKINLGLTTADGQLIALMTFGKSRFNKKYNWELLRFCCLTGYSIIGGASKLLTHFIKYYKKPEESMLSYCNLRYSQGNLYKKLGFSESHTSPPNYYYVTKNGCFAGSRNRWQKHLLHKKLKNYDPTLTEVQNMKMNNYYRIWDCGQTVFFLT